MGIAVIIWILAMLVVIYLMCRNIWVLKSRIKVLDTEGLDEYNKLPSYEIMLFRYPFCFNTDKCKNLK